MPESTSRHFGVAQLVFVTFTALVAGCSRMSDSGIPKALNTDALLRTAGQGQNITFGAVGSGESRSGFAVQSEREFAITISSGTSGQLLAAYRSEVKRQIVGTGAKIHDTGLSGSETNVGAFSYGYSWSGNEGIVRVHSFPKTDSQVVILLFCYEHRR
jgi:hypothetical protein